jgi:hypothetical protein
MSKAWSCAPMLVLLLSGCVPREFAGHHEQYTAYTTGQKFELLTDTLIVEYDYLKVPLVKPGVQLALPPAAGKELDPMFKVTGRMKAGDTIEITDFVIEGGWVPCHGADKYLANPMVKVLTGECAGRRVGLSFLSDYSLDHLVSYTTGEMLYSSPKPDCLRAK